MSLFKSIGKVIGTAARAANPIAQSIPGLGLVTGIASNLGQRSNLMPAMGSLPPLAGIGGRLGAAGAVAGAAVRVGMVGAKAAMRGAITLCRRNPGWCSTIGGTAAVAAMIESGQLPQPKHRRGRGLSSRDLRGFRKTARLMRQVAGTIGLRRSGGRGKGTSSTMITQN